MSTRSIRSWRDLTFEQARRRLARLHGAVRGGAGHVADDRVLAAVEGFEHLLAWRTNAESAAELLLAAIAPFCAERPRLTKDLLPLVVGALRQFPGYDSAGDVVSWLRGFAGAGGGPEPLGPKERRWVRTVTARPRRIQRIMDRMAADEAEEAVGYLRERYGRYSAVPPGRIGVWLTWDAAALRACGGCVVYADTPWSENLRSFRPLTRALAKLDPRGRLKLVVAAVQPWDRPAAFRHSTMKRGSAYIGSAEPQTFWVRRGRVLATAGVGITDRQTFEGHTADLLRRLSDRGGLSARGRRTGGGARGTMKASGRHR